MYDPNFKRGYWRDTWKLMHVPRLTIFMANIVIGIFLSSAIRVMPTVIAIVAVFIAITFGGYSIDELRGRKTNTDISDKELKWRATISISISGLLGAYLVVTVSLLFLPLIVIGLIGLVGYNNNDGRGTFGSLHSRVFFGVIWAFFPLTAFYVFETLSVPPLYVLAIGAFATFFAILHISTYGLFRCKSYKCLDLANAKRDGLDTFPGKCHAQDCAVRRNSIPREIHLLARDLTHLQDYSYVCLTAFIILLHFGV
jgi:hypothetical protein